MNKKRFIIILTVFVLLTLNFSVAHENSTDTLQNSSQDIQVLESADVNVVQASSKLDTQLDVESDTNFDVIGDYFRVKLSDEDNNSIVNTKLKFTVNGKTYNRNTDSNGFASLQLKLKDGTYKIVTKFAGDSNYKASSLTTTITMNNTRVVGSGLSNSEIQSIIDNAKVNNVILFKGKSYSDINLVITKSLTLLSTVDTTLKSSSSNPVITIKGKNASLTSVKGFNIQGNGDGIKVQDSEYVTIYGNDITSGGNGIVATEAKYLNITKNIVVKNSKSGISVANSSYVYIFNNEINSNVLNAIELAKAHDIFIHGNDITKNKDNGIYLAKKINGIDYGQAPYNIHINKNTISKNKNDGILMYYAGDNVNIKGNNIESNKGNGISMAHVGSNTIQSNLISDNDIGIKFFDNYVKPNYQDISYNAVVANNDKDMEAKETYYQENGIRLDVGDNWYGDLNTMCPKIKSGVIKFTVTQIGSNLFQATFTDSKGNIVNSLPDRTLKYRYNGKTVTMTISNGAGVFTADADDGDLVRATVDMSDRDNRFNSKTNPIPEINSVPPSYDYPPIPQYDLYGDIGGGNGNGTGDGSGGDANSGNGKAQQGENTNGNSTHSQQTDPSNNANNPVNDVSQNYDVDTTAQQGASESSSGPASGAGNADRKSVVKQIVIDEDDIVRVAGISFIVLLMILTIAFYYRDDIKEMKSKM